MNARDYMRLGSSCASAAHSLWSGTSTTPGRIAEAFVGFLLAFRNCRYEDTWSVETEGRGLDKHVNVTGMFWDTRGDYNDEHGVRVLLHLRFYPRPALPFKCVVQICVPNEDTDEFRIDPLNDNDVAGALACIWATIAQHTTQLPETKMSYFV